MNNEKTKKAMDRNRVGMISGVVGIFLNLLLSACKIIVGTLVASISMVADGFNNLADMATNVASMIGFHVSQKPADKEHPFGHARFEYIAGLVISILIFFAGVSLFWESILGIFQGTTVVFSLVAIGVLLFSIAVKLGMGVVNLHLSKKINSKTLHAVAIDSFSDTIATFGVIISMCLAGLFDINIDGYIGCLVSVLIFSSGMKVQKDVLSSLLGERITPEQAGEIKNGICKFDGVLSLHDLMVHSYGANSVYASAHVEMDAKIPPLESHNIIDNIEREFESRGIHLVLHYDPVELDNEKTNSLRKMVCDILSDIGSELRIHDFRVVYSREHTNLVFDLVVPFDFRLAPQEVLDILKNEVENKEERFFLVVQLDREI